ncbi:MAG TPA: RNA-binding S4 domain-containing protein [Erysipelothrix sp.]|nr:RNA-binding S4 domain-containing protein [Erysipelothrix sp.]
MRLDKYLKVSKLIKRRAIAKQLADEGRVFVNDALAKPSTDVEVGDEIEIRFEHRHIRVQVTYMSDKMHRNAPSYFELISDVKMKES